jgi:hypothetical protein
VEERVSRRRLQVGPLGKTHVVHAVGAEWGAEILTVGDQHCRKAGAVQSRGDAKARLLIAVYPVHDDRPGMGAAGNEQAGIGPSSSGTRTSAKGSPRVWRGFPEKTSVSSATFIPGLR